MPADAVINSLGALMDAEPDVADGFLMAAVYCRAIRSGEAPRDIAESLYKALPNSDVWPQLRDSLVEVLGEAGGAGEPA